MGHNALVGVHGDGTVTDMVTKDAYVSIGNTTIGTWAAANAHPLWDTTTAGQIKYLGSRTRTFLVQGEVSGSLYSPGVGKAIGYAIALNGTVVVPSTVERTHTNSAYGVVAFSAPVEFTKGDYVEIKVTRTDSNTATLLSKHAILKVNL